jgi:trigger factor
VDVTNVRRKELPTLDDEFARSVNPNAENLDSLRTDLKRYIESRAAHRAREQMFRSIVDALLRKSDFAVPPGMLDRYLEDLAKEGTKGKEEGIDPKEVEHFKEEYRASAIWNLRWYLMRKRIIKQFNLEVADDEFQQEIERLALIDRRSVAEFQKRLTDEQTERIREDLLERKVLSLLEQQVQIVPRPISLAEFEGRTESKLVTA